MTNLIYFDEAELQKLIENIVLRVVSEININSNEIKNTDKRIVSREELAKLLNVSIGWIYLQMKNKKLPYIKKGRRVFFDFDKIYEYLSVERKRN